MWKKKKFTWELGSLGFEFYRDGMTAWVCGGRGKGWGRGGNLDVEGVGWRGKEWIIKKKEEWQKTARRVDTVQLQSNGLACFAFLPEIANTAYICSSAAAMERSFEVHSFAVERSVTPTRAIHKAEEEEKNGATVEQCLIREGFPQIRIRKEELPSVFVLGIVS
jgi:hypothetical protein